MIPLDRINNVTPQYDKEDRRKSESLFMGILNFRGKYTLFLLFLSHDLMI